MDHFTVAAFDKHVGDRLFEFIASRYCQQMRLALLVEVIPGNADRGMAPYDGDFIWKDAGETRSIKNTGTTRLEFIEFELK